MSIAKTKENLKELISDEGNRVIALSGKWGTGKSYLWKSVQTEHDLDAVKDALYVSLFGIKEISQLKLKLAQAAFTRTDEGRIKKLMGEAWKHSSKLMNIIRPNSAASIDEISLLAVPKLLNERFIVIDDIERKHDKLDIGEVMGFIDEYTQLYKARMLLILNSDQLSDGTIWATLREKIIDHEVALKTTAEEAFDIAVQSHPSDYAKQIREAVKICDVTNIRIILKIIRVVNKLLAGRTDMTDTVMRRVVPPTVLLVAIHYKGMVDGPDIDYVSSLNARSVRISMGGSRSELSPEDEARQRNWNSLTQSLGVLSFDDYERLVVDFLASGLLDVDEKNRILDRYIKEKGTLDAQLHGKDLLEKSRWHLDLSDDELLAEVVAVLPDVHVLDVFLMSKIYAIADGLPGGHGVAEQVANNWLQYFLQRDHHLFNFNAFLQHELPPSIRQQFLVLASKKIDDKIRPSLAEVCRKIAENDGWGDEESEVMQQITALQFESEIKRLVGEELRIVMLQSAYMFVNRIGYTDFANGLWSFIAACRKICYDNGNSRLSKTIIEVFQEHRIQSLLKVFDRPLPPPDVEESVDEAVRIASQLEGQA